MATEATSAADLREKLVTEMETKAEATNKARTGKGTRVRVGQTRGKNPQVISWEAFDDSKPDTLPKSLEEFTSLVPGLDEPTLVSYAIDGYNLAQYTAASDPIAEYVNPAWPDAIKAQFRITVRNYSNATQTAIEDAVALIKPGIERAVAAMVAKAAAEKASEPAGV